MRFYFDIDDGEFEDEFGVDFKNRVKEDAINSISDDILSREIGDNWYSSAHAQVEQIIKDKTGVIVDRVVEKVAEKIANKKALASITPKASEIAAIDKSNEEYFAILIDKAIAKKFK